MNVYLQALRLTAAFLLLKSAAAINCFQCNSNEETHCAELFNPDHLDLLPENCDGIYEAKYCVKATGMYEGAIGTRRFCSSRHHGNYCEYVRRPGDDREYRSCVYTCYRDGCNTGSGITASILSLANHVVFIKVIFYSFHTQMELCNFQ